MKNTSKNAELPQCDKTAVISRIFKVTGFLDKRGFDKRIHEIEVTETAKSFVGDGKRISKDKLMKIDTIFFENHNSIRYFTYCLDGQQQLALNKIKEHIKSKVRIYKEEIDVLVSYL
jgi:hypothetical protein